MTWTWIVKHNGEEVGSVLTNHGMTENEIFDMAGVAVAQTEEDYDGIPENGMYDYDELEIVDENGNPF